MVGPLLMSGCEILLLLFGIGLLLCVLAHTHEASLGVLSSLIHFIVIAPFEWGLLFFVYAYHGTSVLLLNALDDLHRRHGDHEHAWRGWAIVGSLFSLVLFMGLAICDFYNTYVKLGPLFGILVPYDPTVFALTLGFSFVLVFITIALGIADLFGMSPMSMFKNLGESEKRKIRKIMLGTMGLALVTVILLMILVSEVRIGKDDPGLLGFFLCCYAVLMLIATFVAGLPLLSAITSVYILILGVIHLVFWLASLLLYLPYRVGILLHDLVIRVADYAAKLGKIIWNKLVPKHPLAEHPVSLPTLELSEFAHLFDRPQNPHGGAVKALPPPSH